MDSGRDRSRTKPPSLLACISCRRSHLKCDGQKPTCRRCSDNGRDCSWIESRRGFRDHRKQATPPPRDRSALARDTHQEQYNQSFDPGSFFFSPSQAVGADAESFVLDANLAAAQPYTYDELFSTSFAAIEVPNMYNDGPASLASFHTQLPAGLDPVSSPGGSTGSSVASIQRDMSLARHTSHNGNESSDLIEVFYKYFYSAHPFIIPQKLAKQRPDLLPEHLRATMRFIAAHYAPNHNVTALQKAAQVIFSDRVPDDIFKLQGLMLYTMACFARYEQSTGGVAMEQAIRLALKIDINKHSFSTTHAAANPILQETFRRTWWSLFILDGLTTAIGGQNMTFRLHNVFCDVPLPSDDTSYNNLHLPHPPRSLSQFRNRTFTEDPFPYSAHAYAIEAMYIMGAIFHLPPTPFAGPTSSNNTTADTAADAIDASISNFTLSLPPSKRECHPDTHTNLLDEPLLLAHMLINWATIMLHRPRSTLTFIRAHYSTICTRPRRDSNPETGGTLPSTSYASHTTRTLQAANTLISLAATPRPLTHCTPTMMCAITAAATVHLPAYAIADTVEHATAIKERLQLGISTLGRFAEIWPRASVAKSQVAGFAREVLTRENVLVDCSAGGGVLPGAAMVTSAGDGGNLLAVEGPVVGEGGLPALQFLQAAQQQQQQQQGGLVWDSSSSSNNGVLDEELIVGGVDAGAGHDPNVDWISAYEDGARSGNVSRVSQRQR